MNGEKQHESFVPDIRRFQELQQRTETQTKLQLRLEDRRAEATQTLKERETERKGREKYYELREEWSTYLIWLLAVMVGFQIVLVLLIGFGALQYQEYRNFLYAAVVESFLQIVGMCWIVVRFLFPHKKET